MSQSTSEPAPEIETWSREDVHHWLTTEVKVHQSCADKFFEEEVSGNFLVDFEKEDVLDLGIKHGPAVKITSHLQRLKEGTQHESQFPADVENWTKEQVTQWLLQHVKVDGEKAERFQQEDVSGDCLVCFTKQDFLDLDLKKGPIVKILKELQRLKIQPEPTPRPVRDFSGLRGYPGPAPQVTQTPAKLTELTESQKENLPLEKPAEVEETFETVQATAPLEATKETAVIPAVVIKNILDKLERNDLKSFKFQLKNYNRNGYTAVPQGKLEDRDTMDIATLVTSYYGCDEALLVTRDILHMICQLDLGSQLERDMGARE